MSSVHPAYLAWQSLASTSAGTARTVYPVVNPRIFSQVMVYIPFIMRHR